MDPFDADLLSTFARSRSEAAFRALVDRHLDHVHSVAWRVTRRHDLAADVAQLVFVRLAERHHRLPAGLSLAAWLHINTRSLAIDLVRTEVARRRREQEFFHGSIMNPPDSATWSELESSLDEAVEALPTSDREAILLRFYQNHTHAGVGRHLGLNEDAARMRVQRALEKLRELLARRGVTTTATALAATLPTHAISAAPAALAASISSAAIGTAAIKTTILTTATATMTKSHAATAAAIAIALPIIVLQYSDNRRLRAEAAGLRDQAGALAAQLSSSPPPITDQIRLSQEAVADPAATPRPPATLQEILAQRDSMSLIRAMLEFADTVPIGDIASVIEELRNSTPEWDPDAKMLMRVLLTRWASENPDAALASLKTMDIKKGEEASTLLSGLAAADPQRAAAWLTDPENPLVDFPFMGQILAGSIGKEWVRQDPAAALAWAEKLPDTQRGGALVGVLGTLAGTDPARAASLATQLDEGGTRRHVIGDIAQAWAKSSPTEAMAWARSLPGEDGTTAMLKSLESWSRNEPAAAASHLDQLAAEPYSGEALRLVTESWVRQAPNDAATWLANRAEGDAKNTAMGTVMWNWTKQNPEAASTWLADQASGPARDAGVRGLALATFDNDPAAALSWAANISDQTSRAESIKVGMNEWLKRDNTAARTWAANNDIPVPEATPPAGK
jgi:RNA polymerase sigma factor (sigma-70 family)